MRASRPIELAGSERVARDSSGNDKSCDMNKAIEHGTDITVDSIQQRLTDYACGLSYDQLSAETIHAAKVRVIDTLGALIGGFFGAPSRIARNLAALMPNAEGATVIGTRMKTTPDMAAFVNGTTARFVEMMDVYHWPGSYHGHPGDVVLPILAAAEHARVGGRELITGIVLAYEVFLRICDVFKNHSIDNTTFCCLASAVAAGKIMGLSPVQLSHCISMAAVPNVVLRQVRVGHASMFKVASSGHAGRAGVFAALLARAGMEGPHLPFEGKAGWCEHVAGERFSLKSMGGNGTSFKILDTCIKIRPAGGTMLSAILAAEKVAPLRNIKDVKQVVVEVYKHAKELKGSGEHYWHWNPDSRETADHSIPYVVAATLMDGTVTPRSYDATHLSNRELRALMKKIEIVENEQFTLAYERLPQEHRTRVTVVTGSDKQLVGEAGGDTDDLSVPKSDAQIVQNFGNMAEDCLGSQRMNAILDRLWRLDEITDVGAIPQALVLG